MKYKIAIKKVVVPLLAPHNYTILLLGGVNYCFQNNKEERGIIFDTSRFSPGELRVTITQCLRSGFPSISFDYSFFRPSFFPYKLDYGSQESFEDSLRVLTEKTIEIVFPYCDSLRKNYIYTTQDMYKELADHTEEKAICFAKRWDLHFARNDMPLVANILYQLQGDNPDRLNAFIQCRDEVIALASYVGQLRHIHSSAAWGWREEFHYYGIQDYDILNRVILAWNCGKEVVNYGLEYLSV